MDRASDSGSECWGFESLRAYHVGAKSALLRRLFMPMAKKTSSARFLAPPFEITTAVLGCDLVLGANLKPGYLYGCDIPKKKHLLSWCFFFGYAACKAAPPFPSLY